MDALSTALSPDAAALAAFLAAAPLAALAGLWDLRRLRIPNRLNVALVLLFLPIGALSLPLDLFGYRIAGALLVLFLGLLLFASGRMGGGDVKMLAAGALYVPGPQAPAMLMLLSAALIAGVAFIYLMRYALGPGERSWLGLTRGARYPMGVSIGAALIVHLGLNLSLPA
ncbi:MAG: prepilin peptidase [Pseudomonadota bacterium]